jgi:outer membrane protein assembly factor BamB
MKKTLISCLNAFLLVLLSCAAEPENATSKWTHFRGSNLDGIAVAENLPVTWDENTNIVWKTAIPEKGWSSPVVLNNQVWLTTARGQGEELYAVCLDFNTGQIIHMISLFRPGNIESIHDLNSYATPTPAIEDGFVYLHFGTYGTACINTATGEKIWDRTDLNCTHVQGPGSSPLIWKDMLILHLEGDDVQFIVALDKKTGETIWETHRPEYLMEPLAPIGRKAYITPVVMNVEGKELLISNGSAVCIAYDVYTGEEVWRVVQGEDSTISMPFVWDGKVYFYTGFFSKPDDSKVAELLAVDPTGKSDVTQTHVLWRYEGPILQLLTPVVIDGLIYTIDTRNVMRCIDAATGETIWEQRVRGRFNASPVYADGKLYFPSTTGGVFVMGEGREFNLLAENKLDGEIWASPAVVDNSLLIRTSKYLYRIATR